jgi:putative drug exporter of the RND superfamily
MLRRLAAVFYRHRRITVAVWVIGMIAVTVIARTVGDDYAQGFRVQGTESARAQDLLSRGFRARSGDAGQLVIHASGGVDRPEVQRRVEALLQRIDGVEQVVSTTSPYSVEGAHQTSADGTVAYGTIQFSERTGLIDDANVQRVVDLAHAGERIDGSTIELGGRMFVSRSFGSSSEAIGLFAAVIILLVAFGSVLAMGLPISTALFGIVCSFGVVTLLSHVVLLPVFTTQLAAMIGIGVGIDYALFIVTRYRQGLHDGLDPERATLLALDTAGRAVLFAGATVVASLCGFFFIGLDFIRGIGLGMAVTVLVTMLASVTFLPAMLGFVGTNIDRFRIPGLHRSESANRSNIWFRWSRVVQRRPWTAALAGLTVLLLLAVPFFSLRLAFSDDGNNPTSDTTRRAYDLLAAGFGPGFNGPLVLAVHTPEGVDALAPLTKALATAPGVAGVSPPVASPDDEQTAVIQVFPTSSPQSEQTQRLVDELRDHVVPRALAGTDVVVDVGGLTAATIDMTDTIESRLPEFIGAVLTLSFVLLLIVFRSVLVPLKAVVMNVLSIAAAYGVLVAIFQWGWLAAPLGIESTGPIDPFIPMMMFAIVFGLSMDYEVFLLSRIREEYDRSGDNGLAVADGLAATARVITAAAAIMVTVFASFVLGDLRIIKLFGVGFAVAILIDATLVRIVLVPATMELLGDRNWWFPRWLEWIPRFHVEAPPDLERELLELQHEQEAQRQSAAD